MNFLIDIIILTIIALFTFIGYKKGLIKVAFGLISFILALTLSIILYNPISNFIIKYTSLDDIIQNTVETRIRSENITEEETNNIITNYYSNIKNSTTSTISNGISKTIISIGCMIIVFVVSKIVLLLFKFSGDLIAKLPLIKQFNCAGGFIYGLIKGFVLIYIFFAIIALTSPIVNINNFINIINSSIIANIMYNNNIIFILFT